MRSLTLQRLLLSLGLPVMVAACAGDRPGENPTLGETPPGSGPMVVFDVLHKPLPLVPLPNDIATRVDERSPSGRYINISKIAPTFLEMDTRAKADQLDGFGAYMPVTVAFDEPLDLPNIVARHRDNDDPTDDAVYLVNIDPNSPEFGRRMPLDIGGGNFPITLEKRNNYFENDEHRASSNILLDTFDEDLNGNGVLDPGEDLDWDGILDSPNLIDPEADPASFLPEGYALGELLCSSEGLTTDDFAGYENLADFYERETNTLLMRPILPLRQLTRYAVVLTNRLVGEDGEPVRSPWPGKHHASQADALEKLPEVLPGLGLSTDDVAFAWVYTTGSTTRELEWIRAGLYGHGPMAWLQGEYPDDQFFADPTTDLENSLYYAPAEQFQAILPLLADELLGGSKESQNAIISDIGHLGGLVMGEFTSPNFLVDRDGIATPDYPADDDEVIEIDASTGEAVHAPANVTWWCALPKRTEAHGDKPFKVVIYGHGYTSQRLEMLAFAGRAARFGLALCGLDAFGHGLVLPSGTIDFGGQQLTYAELIKTLLPSISNLGPFAESLLKGRARDLDNNGEPDSGGDFWTADLFHTRDVVRQTIVDHMRFIQLLRAFDGERRWVYDTDGNGKGDLAGDFDGDGIVDLGGRADNYYMWGQSLGGIVAGVLAGIEPSLVAAAPVAGGAGLTDIGIRSRQSGVPEAVFLPLMGPFVVGNPSETGGVALKFLVNNVNNQSHHPFAVLESALPGDRIEVVNLNNDERAHAVVPTDRKFRIPIPADALTATERRPLLGLDDPTATAPVAIAFPQAIGDRLRITVYNGLSEEVRETLDTFEQDVNFQGTIYASGKPLVAISKGLGLRRNAPELRRMLSVAQMIIEGGDPVSFAPHYDDPLDFSYDPEATPGVNVLVIPTAGDMNVPVNTGINNARAAGFIELEAADPRFDGSAYAGKSINRVLIDTFTVESIECLPRWRNADGEPVLFDIDDLDFGFNPYGEPGLPEATNGAVEPLRLTIPASFEGGGVHGMRIPVVRQSGNHGFGPPSPDRAYDIDNYMNNLIYHYFNSGGTVIADDACLEDSSCGSDGPVTLPFEQASWEAGE